MAGISGTLITVAPTGAEADKAAVPALPVTVAELVATAKECEAAGAAVIHVHIRDDAARPTLDRGRLANTVAALREATDLIVQLSTGGATWDSFDDRLAAAGYLGTVVVEVKTSRALSRQDRLADLAESLAFARQHLSLPEGQPARG